LTVADFRNLEADSEQKEIEHREEARRAAAAGRRQQVTELIDHHVSDENWRALLHQARQAAEHGQNEFMLLRLPSQLCSDGGRLTRQSRIGLRPCVARARNLPKMGARSQGTRLPPRPLGCSISPAECQAISTFPDLGG
jgi:hypothetical protein